MDTSFLAFISISILVIVTPGPDTALVIRNTDHGRAARRRVHRLRDRCRAGDLGARGERRHRGAARRVGARVPRGAARAAPPISSISARDRSTRRRGTGNWQRGRSRHAPAQRLSSRAAFRQGLASDLSNPKMAAFFTSLLPQFATTGDGAFVHMLRPRLRVLRDGARMAHALRLRGRARGRLPAPPQRAARARRADGRGADRARSAHRGRASLAHA